MSDSNITKLSSLALEKVNSKDPYTINAPSDGTLALGNIENVDIPNIINNENYNPLVIIPNTETGANDIKKIKNGTILFNRNTNDSVDPTKATQAVQFFYNGKPVSIAGFSGDLTQIQQNQLAMFSVAGNSNSLTGAVADNNAVTVGQLTLKAIQNNPALKKRAESQNSLPSVGGISGVEVLDFSDFGFITVNELQFITLNLGAASGKQNVLVTDDQTSSAPTSYNALLEVRTTKGGFMFPRLTTAQVNALSVSSADKGLALFNSDTNKLAICNGTSFDSVSTVSIIRGTGTLNGIMGSVVSVPSLTATSQVIITPLITTDVRLNPLTIGSIRVSISGLGTALAIFTVYSSVSGDTASYQWMVIN